MKRLIPLLLIVFSSLLMASDEDEVRARFDAYWAAFSQKDFATAAEYMDPAELAQTQQLMRPLFLEAAGNPDAEIREIVSWFYTGVPEGRRETMSAAEVFAGINQIIVNSQPEVFDLLGVADVTIKSVHLRGADTAILVYELSLLDASEEDTQYFSRHDGQWYLKFRDDPAKVAEQFRTVFGQ